MANLLITRSLSLKIGTISIFGQIHEHEIGCQAPSSVIGKSIATSMVSIAAFTGDFYCAILLQPFQFRVNPPLLFPPPLLPPSLPKPQQKLTIQKLYTHLGVCNCKTLFEPSLLHCCYIAATLLQPTPHCCFKSESNLTEDILYPRVFSLFYCIQRPNAP